MLHITFYLHNPKARISPIYARVHPGDYRASTQISIEPKYWALKSKKGAKLPRGIVVNKWVKPEHPYANQYNLRLRELNNIIFEAYHKAQQEGRNLEHVNLPGLIDPAKAKKGKVATVTIRQYLEAWAEKYKKRKLRSIPEGEEKAKYEKKVEDYTRSYKQVIDKWEEFMPKVRPQQITEEVIDAFEEWLPTKHTVQSSTVRKYRKTIRQALKEAGLPYDWLHIGSADVATKYDLYWDEIIALRDTKYENESQRRAAHTFVIQCQLALRFDDISSLKPIHFFQVKLPNRGEVTVINKSQGKTGDAIYIPVPATSAALIAEHGGIPVLKTKRGKISLQKYNEHLKEAAKKAGLTRAIRQTERYGNNWVKEMQKPLHEVISSHDARHTGASRVLAVTKEEMLVKKLLGHSSGDVTAIYSHYNPYDVAERLLDAWEMVEQQG